MELNELKKVLKDKTIQFEIAMENGQPHSELLKIYKELKELQYQQLKAELELVTD
jgi:hypothetical protein